MKIQVSFLDNLVTYTKPIKLPKGDLINNIFTKVILTNDHTHTIDIFSLPGFYKTNLAAKKMALDLFFKNRDFNFKDISLFVPYFNTTNFPAPDNGEILFDLESAIFPFIQYALPENNVILSHSFSLEHLEKTKCIKIKISPEKEKLMALANFLNSKSLSPTFPILRFDGNRKFELTDLIFFLNQLNASVVKKIEYIEEPFKNYYDVFTFKQLFKIPIAIDESLIYFSAKLDLLPKQTPIILKPAIFGISTSFELIRLASQLGHNVIISSTYQPASTFYSLLALAYYSDSFHKEPHYHGLDTLCFLPIPYQSSPMLSPLSIS